MHSIKALFRLENKIEKIAFFFLISSHLLAAYFSFGYHHPDEHYQIWEWAHVFLGLSDASHLHWEYTAQIRPWFQPLLHAGVMKLFLNLDAYNPFSIAVLMRALYGFANCLSLLALWNTLKSKTQLSSLWFLFIACLWFFPYIHVRTSSENLSGIFLTFAFASYIGFRKIGLSGILFGFAFLARPQIALGLVGLGGFLVYQDKRITLKHLKLLLGFTAIFALGLLIDRWGYGNWVVTPYRYFTVNLVDGVAATFNPYPWYQYFIWIAELNPFVSLPLFLGFIFYFKKRTLEPLGAFCLAFFFFHLLITNKEYRFLFPILNIAPFLAAVGLRNQWGESALASRKILIPYLIMSLLAFSVSALRGASVHSLWPSHITDRVGMTDEVWLSNRGYNDPLYSYYTLTDQTVLSFNSVEGQLALMDAHPSSPILIDGRMDDPVTQNFLKPLQDRGCKRIVTPYPAWLYELRTVFPAINSRIHYQAVYRCFD